jgi:hypothetical protein
MSSRIAAKCALAMREGPAPRGHMLLLQASSLLTQKRLRGKLQAHSELTAKKYFL